MLSSTILSALVIVGAGVLALMIVFGFGALFARFNKR
jgi:hypothetical protein